MVDVLHRDLGGEPLCLTDDSGRRDRDTWAAEHLTRQSVVKIEVTRSPPALHKSFFLCGVFQEMA